MPLTEAERGRVVGRVRDPLLDTLEPRDRLPRRGGPSGEANAKPR
ncbi:hypothetical protein [Streptomyces litmocidini]